MRRLLHILLSVIAFGLILIGAYAPLVRGAMTAPMSGPYGAKRTPYADGWWRAGIPGGIPATNGENVFCDPTVSIPGSGLICPTDGVSDCSAAVQTALTLAGAIASSDHEQIVLLPPGQFLYNSSLFIPSFVRLIGSGMGKSGTNDPAATVCYNTQTATGGGNIFPELFQFGGSHNFAYAGTTNALLYGSNEIDVSLSYWSGINGGGLYKYGNSGFMIIVAQTNDPNIVELKGYAQEGGLNNGSNVMSQVMTVTNLATNGNCVRMLTAQSFYYSYGLTNHPMSLPVGLQCFHSGIENLEIAYKSENPANSTGPCVFLNSVQCWAKNVHIYHFPADGFTLNQTVQCEIRGCWLETAAYNSSARGYGFHVLGPNSDYLIEDNIAQQCRHSLICENGGDGGVFAYNYVIGDANSQETDNTLTFDGLMHAACPYMVLFEGNYMHMLAGDFIHGNAWGISAFRNWFTTGTPQYPPLGGDTNYPDGFVPTQGMTALYIAPTNWWWNVEDNILGTSYFSTYGASAYTNAASGAGGVYIWTVGVDLNVVPQVQTDGKSWNTLYQDGNIDYSSGPSGQVIWDSSPHAFDNSAILRYSNSIPSEFGYPTNQLINFPPFGNDVTVSIYILPAALRWWQLSAGISIPANGVDTNSGVRFIMH